ncbi:MAG: hypothetical protein F6K00_18035 [Leptolyngbya sp. SIOISBB]|nr:hypothetical protein [Leptolyngbya sp. SIOISBB]
MMNRFYLLWGVPLLLPLVGAVSPAIAQCVVADVAVQTAVTGSRQPTEQINEVDIEAEGACVGNTSVSTSRQVQVGGTGQVRQTRQSRHRIRGQASESASPVTGPTVAVPVEVQVDVYNPAEQLRRQRSQ